MANMSRRLQMLDIEGILYFYELDLSMYGLTDKLYFHCNGSTSTLNVEENRYDVKDTMTYRGNEYAFVGADLQDVELSSDGKVTAPTFRVVNKLNGQLGAVTALCSSYNDLTDAILTVRACTAEAYDAGTFEEIEQMWWVDRKSDDNGVIVTFDLTSALDHKKKQIPSRMIIDLCTWAMRGEYRGEACGYTGDKYFDKHGKPVDTIDQDDCGGECSDCILRYGRGVPLPFGGFLIVNKTNY